MTPWVFMSSRARRSRCRCSRRVRSSRLCAACGVSTGGEFDKYVDGINDDVHWHRGRCLSYGEGVAFWALAEMVRGRLGILEGDGTDVVVERLRQGLEGYVPAPDDRVWL